MATDPFSNFKATPFVSQYAGLPIEEFAQSAQVLQQRGIQNREQLDKLDMMAYEIQTAPIDESVKQARIQAIRDEQERIAQSGAYEMAGDLVRGQVKDFTRDKRLQTAQGNYAQYMKDLEESEKYNPAQQVKIQKAYRDYVASGGVGEMPDEFGRYNRMSSVSFYEDVDVQEKLDKLVNDWKSDKVAWAQKAREAGYITSGSNEEVTEQEVREAATQMLMADPKISRQLEDEAKYLLYRQSGDLSALDKSATEVIGTQKVKNPKTGEIEERDITAMDYVMSNYVDPFATRESFLKQERGLKADPNFGSGASSDASKLGDITYMTGSAVNFGYVPDYNSYTQEVQTAVQTVAGLEQELLVNISDKRRAEVLDQLANARGEVSRLNEYKQEFTQNLPETDKLALLYSDKLKALGLDDSKIASAYMSSSDRQATNQTDAYKAKMSEYRDLARATYEEAYLEVYGQPAPTTGRPSSYSEFYKQGDKVNNKMFSDNDFKGFINNLHETASTAPGIYQFSDKLRSSGGLNTLRTAVQAGNISVYHSGAIGKDEDAAAMIKKIPDLQMVGATQDAGKGSQIAVRVPTYTETDLKKISDSDVRKFIEDNQGKTFYVEELGANNLTTKVNSLMLEASKAYQTSASLGNVAGANYAQEFLDDSRDVANPNYFATELERSATSRTPTDLFVPGGTYPAAKLIPTVVNGTTYFKINTYNTTTGEVAEEGTQQLTKSEADVALQNLYNHYNK
jgi:hypothetical protein